jgi:hypothetical protein
MCLQSGDPDVSPQVVGRAVDRVLAGSRPPGDHQRARREDTEQQCTADEVDRDRCDQRADQGGGDDHRVVDAEDRGADLVLDVFLENGGRSRLDTDRGCPGQGEGGEHPG